jgi:capsular polysaccharide transport system permease protein
MRGVMVQLQVIHAILLREMKTRFGEHQWGYAWALIGPMLWVGTFAVLYHLLGRLAPPGMSVIGFLVTGIVTFELFRNTSTQSLAAISGNKGLLFYPQVRPLDLVAARALLEGVTQVVVFVLLMGGAALLEGKLRMDSALTTLAGLTLAGGLGASFGLVLCGLSTLSPTVERIHGPLMRPMFWFSAIFYPVDSVPTALRDVLLYNPVVHAIEIVRDGWFPGYQTRHISPWYPAAWILVLLFFGLSLERVARRRLQLS